MGNNINTHTYNNPHIDPSLHNHNHNLFHTLTVSDVSSDDSIDLIAREHLDTIIAPPAAAIKPSANNGHPVSSSCRYARSLSNNTRLAEENCYHDDDVATRSTLPHPNPAPNENSALLGYSAESEPRSSEPPSREPASYSQPSSRDPKSMEDEITPANTDTNTNNNNNNYSNVPRVLPRYDDKNTPLLDDRVAVLVAAPLSNTRADDAYTRNDSQDIDMGNTTTTAAATARGIRDSISDLHTTMTVTPGGVAAATNENSNQDAGPSKAHDYYYSPNSARRVAQALSSLVFSNTAGNSAGTSSNRATPSNNNYLNNRRPDVSLGQIIPLVVRSLAEFRKDPDVVHAAILTLTQLLSKNAHSIHLHRAKLAACGGVEAILDVMRIHSVQQLIQSQGCLLIATLAHQAPGIKLRALNAGALLVIIGGMSVHPGVEQVQALGCYALRNITKVDPALVHDPHAAAAAVEVIAHAMEKLPRSRTVQMQAMCALTNVAALSEVAKARIGTMAVINSIILALERDLDNASATDVALACLAVLVTDIDNQAKAVAFGVVDAIAGALARYIHNFHVVSKAASCIRFLTYEISTRVAIGQGHIIFHLIDALNTHLYLDSPHITIREIMHAIGNSVAGIPANKALAHGAVQAAVDVIRKYVAVQVHEEQVIEDEQTNNSNNSTILLIEDACRLLYALLNECPENQANAAENGLLSAVLEGLRLYACTSARIAEHGTAVFAVLAYNVDLLPEVQRGASDLASILRRARNAHKNNNMVERQIRSLINGLGIAEDDMALAWPSGLGDPWKKSNNINNNNIEFIISRLRCRNNNDDSHCTSSGCI